MHATPKESSQTLTKHPKLGEILARMINYKTYLNYKVDNCLSNNELNSLKGILTPLEFEQAQTLMHTSWFQSQLADPLKLAITSLTNKNSQFEKFLFNLDPAAEKFLLNNEINLNECVLAVLERNLNEWINEAPVIEKSARTKAKTTIQEAYTEKSKFLDLSSHNLTTLPGRIFIFLPNLVQLNLSHNEIDTLPEELFNFTIYQNQLDLAKNQVYVFTDEEFDSFDYKELPNLSHHQLTSIPSNQFVGLTQLLMINLSYNQLFNIPAVTFNGLFNLQGIDLSNNGLEILPDGLFQGLTNLKWLNLTYNRIRILHEELFKDLENYYLDC
jgi:hypothetical protein